MKAFETFITKMTKMVHMTTDDSVRVTEAEQLISKLIEDDSWLSEKFRVPDQGRYARHSLYIDPENQFEVIALVWLPGQKTPIHDHDGTWGVEGVLSGRMRVYNYLEIGETTGDVVQLRHAGTLTISEQSTGQLLPPADCHELEAVGCETSVTIHVYGKHLEQFMVFKPLEEKETYQAINYKISSKN